MLGMQSRCKCITAWLQTKEMAFIVHTTVGSCSKAILIVDRVCTGLLFQDFDDVEVDDAPLVKFQRDEG